MAPGAAPAPKRAAEQAWEEREKQREQLYKVDADAYLMCANYALESDQKRRRTSEQASAHTGGATKDSNPSSSTCLGQTASAARDAVTSSAPADKRKRAFLWFRRDLRLDDNPALMAALRSGYEVIPIFVWAPEEEGVFTPGRTSRWWLDSSVRALKAQLEAIGSKLLLYRSERSIQSLMKAAKDHSVQHVFFNHLYDPISLVRDNQVRTVMRDAGISVESFGADLLYEPWEVHDEGQKPFVCFEAFHKKYLNMSYQPLVPLPAPNAMPAVGSEVVGDLPDVDSLGLLQEEERDTCENLGLRWKPGADSAWAAWEDFVAKKLATFSEGKKKVDGDHTSMLSGFMHFGEISVRRMYYQLRKVEFERSVLGLSTSNVNAFLKQLCYREYSRYLIFHNPFTHERPMLEHLRAVPWSYDQDLFKLWQQGCVGYPLIDAALQELWSTGWIHNGLRVVVAHFLVKFLNLPWQWGLKYFWDSLVDADLECDVLGWQYVAGCTVDAQPFSYLMDYEEECLRFDPDGIYVRKWCPLLSKLPRKFIHVPWKAPIHVLRAAGVELGTTYPLRVVMVDQAKQQVAQACRCIEEKASGPSQGPFRHPSMSESKAGSKSNKSLPGDLGASSPKGTAGASISLQNETSSAVHNSHASNYDSS